MPRSKGRAPFLSLACHLDVNTITPYSVLCVEHKHSEQAVCLGSIVSRGKLLTAFGLFIFRSPITDNSQGIEIVV